MLKESNGKKVSLQRPQDEVKDFPSGNLRVVVLPNLLVTSPSHTWKWAHQFNGFWSIGKKVAVIIGYGNAFRELLKIDVYSLKNFQYLPNHLAIICPLGNMKISKNRSENSLKVRFLQMEKRLNIDSDFSWRQRIFPKCVWS